MNLKKNKKGVTLIEILISIALFSVVAVISTSILVSIVNLEKVTSIHNALYQDARILLRQLSKEIQTGTIDYDEYFNIYVAQDAPPIYYGQNYGVYHSRFFDPGRQLNGMLTSNPADLGVECSWPVPYNPDFDECEVFYKESIDSNTGQNPFTGNYKKYNALCQPEPDNCNTKTGVVDELYLIDHTGTKKTIIGKKLIDGVNLEYAIGIVRLEGSDSDQNGVIDKFVCSDEFTCTFIDAETELPEKSDLSTPLKGAVSTTQFIPITSTRFNVEGLAFIINPIEDPYKAYAEDDMQDHPSVTIFITFGLTEETEKDYPGIFTPITVQTTVAAGVLGPIKSYPPISEILPEGGASWIENDLSLTSVFSL